MPLFNSKIIDEQQQDLKEEANKNAFKKLEIHATQNVNVAQESAPSQRYDGKQL